VLVLRNAGPRGGPGMPEWGTLPIPAKLLREGVKDMVRVSDARMSGTAFGTTVLHVAPEAAVGGPLATVRDGDPIELDYERRKLELAIPAEELNRRLEQLDPARPHYRRGYGACIWSGCFRRIRLATSTSSARTPRPRHAAGNGLGLDRRLVARARVRHASTGKPH
jgi:dihydroxyacid dehydratase/phosphogluconate dehydratase